MRQWYISTQCLSVKGKDCDANDDNRRFECCNDKYEDNDISIGLESESC